MSILLKKQNDDKIKKEKERKDFETKKKEQ